MTDPKRLSLEPESALEAELLKAGRPAAPAGAKERALLVASSVGIATGLGATGAAAEGTSAATAFAKAGSLIALKWVGIVSVTGAAAVVVTTALEARPHAHRAEQAKASPPAVAAAHEEVKEAPKTPSAVTVHPAPTAPPALAAFSPAVIASGRRRSAGSAVVKAAPASDGPRASEGASTLPAELALLERAQAALNAGETSRAVALLDAYAAGFPRGDMSDEAMVLRIEAYARAGDHTQASHLGDAFLARAPGSPYAARIRSVLVSPNP